MQTWMWIAVIVAVAVAVVALVLVAWWLMHGRRTRELRKGFGPEYDRAVRVTGDRRRAEQELQARRERVAQMRLRLLTPGDRSRFSAAWLTAQSHFVDAPAEAVRTADRLVAEVMKARGYPVADFDRRAADVSVEYPLLVANYRAARDVALRDARGQTSTEELRQAMVQYRSLFDALTETRPVEKVKVRAS